MCRLRQSLGRLRQWQHCPGRARATLRGRQVSAWAHLLVDRLGDRAPSAAIVRAQRALVIPIEVVGRSARHAPPGRTPADKSRNERAGGQPPAPPAKGQRGKHQLPRSASHRPHLKGEGLVEVVDVAGVEVHAPGGRWEGLNGWNSTHRRSTPRPQTTRGPLSCSRQSQHRWSARDRRPEEIYSSARPRARSSRSTRPWWAAASRPATTRRSSRTRRLAGPQAA